VLLHAVDLDLQRASAAVFRRDGCRQQPPLRTGFDGAQCVRSTVVEAGLQPVEALR
jgi:hypothetical protein